MVYQINGLPVGFAIFPPLVSSWIKRIKADGIKVGNRITFSMKSISQALRKEGVPHVATFLEENIKSESLVFEEKDCQ